MKTTKLTLAIMIYCVSIVMPGLIHAGGLVIEQGGGVTVSGGVLDINCQPIELKSGGSLTLDEGEIIHCKTLKKEAGSTFNKNGWPLRFCFTPEKLLPLLLNK